jgi:hypothetical protein
MTTALAALSSKLAQRFGMAEQPAPEREVTADHRASMCRQMCPWLIARIRDSETL